MAARLEAGCWGSRTTPTAGSALAGEGPAKHVGAAACIPSGRAIRARGSGVGRGAVSTAVGRQGHLSARHRARLRCRGCVLRTAGTASGAAPMARHGAGSVSGPRDVASGGVAAAGPRLAGGDAGVAPPWLYVNVPREAPACGAEPAAGITTLWPPAREASARAACDGADSVLNRPSDRLTPSPLAALATLAVTRAQPTSPATSHLSAVQTGSWAVPRRTYAAGHCQHTDPHARTPPWVTATAVAVARCTYTASARTPRP